MPRQCKPLKQLIKLTFSAFSVLPLFVVAVYLRAQPENLFNYLTLNSKHEKQQTTVSTN